jgi:hypothetical protein
MRTSTTRATLVLSLVALAVTLGTITGASAYWSDAGGGAGSAGTSTGQPVTLSPGTPAASLYPGGQAAVVLTIVNPDPAQVLVGSLALDTTQGSAGFAVDGTHAGCSTTALSFTTQTNGGSGWTIPGGGSLPVTLPASLSMSASAADACQGATFTVYLRAGA